MAQLFPLFIGIPLIGFWFWMLVDLANNDHLTRESKNNWFLALVLLNVVGAFWYFMVDYRNRHWSANLWGRRQVKEKRWYSYIQNQNMVYAGAEAQEKKGKRNLRRRR